MAKKQETYPVQTLLTILDTELGPAVENAQAKAQEERRALESLKSVALGLYDEVDKLVKKSPVDLITPLVLEQVNGVIVEAKELGKQDSHMQKLVPFVAAGDNPEQRDVLVILRLVKQGMERLHVLQLEQSSILATLKSDLRALTHIFKHWMELGSATANVREYLDDVHSAISTNWKYGTGYTWQLDMPKINEVHIRAYFDVSKL